MAPGVEKIPDHPWLRAVVPRAALLGLALATAVSAGSTIVLGQSPLRPVDGTVLLATTLLAVAVGGWAGTVEGEHVALKLRSRWLSAAAVTAAAGAYATFAAVYEPVFPGSGWKVAGLLVGVAAPAYALGLILPLLLGWADHIVDEDLRDTGPATLLGPIVIGILGGAAIGLLLAGLVLLPRLGPGSLLIVTAFALVVPLALDDRSDSDAIEQPLHEAATPFGVLRVTEVVFPGERQPERRLYLNDEEESGELVRSGAPTMAYVSAAESWLTATTSPGAEYLFLGGGAYTLPRRIAERDPKARITVVELDPDVTRIAYSFFGLSPHHRIESVHGDARAFLDSCPGQTFDRIYIDVYGGRETLPYSLVTREAATNLRRRLEPHGVVAMNVIGTVAGDENCQAWSVVQTFADVFPSVALYTHLGRDYPERQNLMLTASSESDHDFALFAGLFELWPRPEWPPVEGATVFHDVVPPVKENTLHVVRNT